MGTFSLVSNGVVCLAILCVGVIYGTDAFFALVGQRALVLSSEGGVTDVMGHIHEVADARMPIVGALGILATVAFLVLTGLGTIASTLGIVALVAQLLFLVLYNVYSKPINVQLKQAAHSGQVLVNVRQLQARWDRVVVARTILLLIAMICLLIAALTL